MPCAEHWPALRRTPAFSARGIILAGRQHSSPLLRASSVPRLGGGMTVTPTYPGVYVVELPSSVRTITAVSTSVTAFVGYAVRGPVNTPVTLTSFADFERRFGGLAVNSVLSYSVQQFFLNGGSIAIVVRVARDAVAASK